MQRTAESFSNQIPEYRMFVRNLIENAFGGHIKGYNGKGLTVALPNNHEAEKAIRTAMNNLGWNSAEYCYFPLVSDKPVENLRHFNGRYQRAGDAPAYWKYETFE